MVQHILMIKILHIISIMIQNCIPEPVIDNSLTPSYPLFMAIQNLLNSVTNKKTYKDAKADINSFIQHIGYEGERFVLLSLLEGLDMAELKDKSSSSTKLQFFIDIMKEYSANPNFLSYFPEVLVSISKDPKPNNWIQALLNSLKVPLVVQISIALSLYLSDKYDFSEEGGNQLIKKLIELRKSAKGPQLPQKIIDEILFQISRNPQLNLKLEEEYCYLLQICETTGKLPESKMLTFFKADWQSFSTDLPMSEKIPNLPLKKVEFLRDAGPPATFQVEALKAIMSEVGNLTEEDIFEFFMLITEEKGRLDNGMDRFLTDFLYANKKNLKSQELKKVFNTSISSKKSQGTWNIDNLISYCCQSIPGLKWQNVINQFDRPKLTFSSPEHFLNLMKLFEKTRKISSKWKMPEHIFFKKWIHTASQAEFLIEVFKCKEPQVLHLQEIPNRRLQLDAKQSNKMQKQIWGYLDLVQLLIQVSEERKEEIRDLIEGSLEKYPEIIMQTLCQIRPSKGEQLLEEIFCQSLKGYLEELTPDITRSLGNFWQLNRNLFISSVCKIYKQEAEKKGSFNIFRIHDLTQEIKDSLIPFTIWHDYDVSIPLAFIGAKRQKLNFDPWLADRIEISGQEFIKAILQYVRSEFLAKMNEDTLGMREQIMEIAQLSTELLNRLFSTIMVKVKNQSLEPQTSQLFTAVYKQCCSYVPEITEGQISDQMQKQTIKEITKIYREQITVSEGIEKMIVLKNSSKQQDQEQLASHITFLCSQLTYHHSYPEKQLMVTASLFAGIINANLIEKKVYQMVLHVIDEDLKEDNEKYLFAIKVIQEIKQKLSHESWFCQKLLDNEVVMKKDPELVEQLIKSIQPPIILSVEKEKKIKQAIKIKKMVPEKIMKPMHDIPIEQIKKPQNKDYDILSTLDKTKKIKINDKESKLNKINLICNTISLSNLDEKARDLDKILDTHRSVTLVAHCIVFKRITMAQNNGNQIFYRLTEKVHKIYKPILKLTYKIIQEWFKLEGKSVNDKKHNHFKNIGSWLGKMTIGQGTPIPIYKLYLKQILIKSFSTTNRISLNIPVVLKILQYINLHPHVFRINSPWLSRLFGTLNQIQQKLKEDQTTKSEIKAFFRSTKESLDHFNIPQTSYLTTSRFMISELDKYIIVNQQLSAQYQSLDLNFKMLITQAVDLSIQEIVEPVIDRAVKIAKVTTKQLIMKDFALEPDPLKLQQSSFNMIKNMAGPLAQVTCRQPLKASMNRNMKILLQKTINDQSQIEQIIDKIIPDNLDFGCKLIKQAVIESAEDAIKKDEKIREAIEMRKKAKQTGETFQDDFYLNEIPTMLPEELRPKIGGLTPEQILIYTEFKNEKIIEETLQKDHKFTSERIAMLLKEKEPIDHIKQLMVLDQSNKEEIMVKVHEWLVDECQDESYGLGVCAIMKEFMGKGDCWENLKPMLEMRKKNMEKMIIKLIEIQYLPTNCLQKVPQSNEDEQKSIKLFEMWLDTAHEDIEPFLRNLQQFFNLAEHQIKLFFNFSLGYVIGRVESSLSNYSLSFDSSYLEAYSKLIIISYKTIATRSCGCYLEHTIQAIFQVFNRIQCECSNINYQQRCFFKLFTNLICDVNRKEYDIENEKVSIFYCILAKELKKISPLIHPSFAFAWSELISNRYFMPTLLDHNQFWDLYYQLLACLLRFVREFITEDNITNKEHGHKYEYFYKGVLKLILMIMHDYPHFLSQFSLQLCLLAGEKFVQLNNMIISAYPSQMKFEYPAKILKRDKLLQQAQKGGLPKYYRLRFDRPKLNQFLNVNAKDSSFKEKLNRESEENIQILILYISWQSESKLSQGEAREKLLNILKHSSNTMKERLINYIINLIRYPNTITLFFIDFFSWGIFHEIFDKECRNLILSIIIKRTDAEGPHPWGLLYFVQQLQNMKNNLAGLHVPKHILDLL